MGCRELEKAQGFGLGSVGTWFRETEPPKLRDWVSLTPLRPSAMIPSPNFSYLAHHDERLVALGTQAEESFAQDPDDEPADAMLARLRASAPVSDSKRSSGRPAPKKSSRQRAL